MKVLVTQSCPTLCNPMDCSQPGSSVHGIFEARILEWVSMPFSRRSPWPRGQTQVSSIAGKFYTVWATREVQFSSILWQCYKVTDENTTFIIPVIHNCFIDPKSFRHCRKSTECPWNAQLAFKIYLTNWWGKHRLWDPSWSPRREKTQGEDVCAPSEVQISFEETHFSFLIPSGITDVINTWRNGAFPQFVLLCSGPAVKVLALAIPSFSRIYTFLWQLSYSSCMLH